MNALLLFLADYEVIIYAILGLGIFTNLRSLWHAQKQFRESVFGLEKNITRQRMSASIARLAILVVLFLGELILVSFIAPTLPAVVAAPESETASAVFSLPTILPGAKESTLVSEPPPGSTGCLVQSLVITEPRVGQDLSGIVELWGTVNIPNLGFYKFEVATRGSGSWKTIFAGQEPKNDESLGKWDTSQLAPGDYELRVLVADNQGVELTPCVIAVHIVP